MENNKNKKSVKFQGDVLNFCDFIQVFVFTRNHHLKQRKGALRQFSNRPTHDNLNNNRIFRAKARRTIKDSKIFDWLFWV